MSRGRVSQAPLPHFICSPNYTKSGRPMTDRPRSDAHAAASLGDAAFIAYALMQGFKLIMALFRKRWPELT
jgi:hypothetical protein